MSIKWKILLITLISPMLIAILLAWQRVSDIQTSAEESIVTKSKAIVEMAATTSQEMSDNLQRGVIPPLESMELDKVFDAIPIVTAMRVAAKNAESGNYTFKVPKFNPRNPDNEPDEVERKVLTELQNNPSLTGKIIREKDQIRYFKPIKLTSDCMVCHGDPKGEDDILGFEKEGWRVGEIHGAFEVISSLSDAKVAVRKATIGVVVWTLALLIITAGIVWFLLQKNVITPLALSSKVMQTIAGGDLSQKISVTSKDEFGTMMQDLGTMSQQLGGMIQNILTTGKTVSKNSDDLTSLADNLSVSSQSTAQNAISVTESAEEMSSNMNSVAAATEEAATNVSMVASSTDAMTSTFNAIADSTYKARSISEEAVREAQSASTKVDELGRAASQIGKVTETITEISEQTNLLALNATIEAARAGEAGKGFAVVANEIKDLAKQTADATQEIRSQIEGIQNSTSGTVGQIEQISKVINDVCSIVTNVVDLVQGQLETTQEIADNISQASVGIVEVTENVSRSSALSEEVARDIGDVSRASLEMSQSSSAVKVNAQELRVQAQQLIEMVSQFKM